MFYNIVADLVGSGIHGGLTDKRNKIEYCITWCTCNLQSGASPNCTVISLSIFFLFILDQGTFEFQKQSFKLRRGHFMMTDLK